ncbi:MAG: helix-turn-helix transcriptional regulator [Acidobacteria bacterium]|nr:helix-turn-helix transcriptional regulator [Acidobacteriota bacterium]
MSEFCPRIHAEWLFRGRSVSLHSWSCRGPHGTAGEEKRQRHFEIAVVLEGGFHYRGPRGSAVGDANTAICFDAEESYETRHRDARGDAGLALVLEPPALRELFGDGDRVGFRDLCLPVLPRAHLFISLLRNRLACSGGTPEEIVIEETLFHMVRVVWEGRHPKSARGARAGFLAARERVESVQEIMATEYARPLRLDDLATRVALSPQHLCRVFKAQTGLAVHRYLNRLRLRAALPRLLDPRSDLTSIAFDAGFSSHSHFTAAYRREFGVTPSGTRRLARDPRHARILTAS